MYAIKKNKVQIFPSSKTKTLRLGHLSSQCMNGVPLTRRNLIEQEEIFKRFDDEYKIAQCPVKVEENTFY